MIRTYNAEQGVQVFGALSTIDYGDAPTVPGYIEDTLGRIEGFVAPLVAAGVTPIGMGGDHSVTLAELRALAKVHGPLGLVHFDSRGPLGKLLRAALRPRHDVPSRTRGGCRGSLPGSPAVLHRTAVRQLDEGIPDELGVEMIPWRELVGA